MLGDLVVSSNFIYDILALNYHEVNKTLTILALKFDFPSYLYEALLLKEINMV